VIRSLRTDNATGGPAKIDATVSISVKGTPKSAQIAAFTGKPITLTVSGPADTKARKADLALRLEAGPLSVTGAIREDRDRAWLQFNGKWYRLPPGAFSSNGTAGGATLGLDAGTILRAFGAPSSVLRQARVVGADDVGGVPSDHLSAVVPQAAAARALGGLASRASAAGGIGSQLGSLGKDVKTTRVDLWVGQGDHVVHRVKTVMDGIVAPSTRAATGVDGYTVSIDATSTPTGAVHVSSPSGAAPFGQLQQSLGGLLGGTGGSA
jgi:hypothetical protein